MSARHDPLDRLRAVNPLPEETEPDWDAVRAHVEEGSRDTEAGRPTGGIDRPTGREGEPTGTMRGGQGRRRPLLGAFALSAVLAIGALIAVAPWSNSSGFLARAAAALTPDAGTVLYERWEHTISPEGADRSDAATFGPEQLWIEGSSPHRYRAILQAGRAPAERSDLAWVYGVNVAWSGRTHDFINHVQRELAEAPLEIGGKLEVAAGTGRTNMVLPALTFVAPDRLVSGHLAVALGASLPGPHDQIIERGPDPVSALRAAIEEGRAHEAGSTQLDGRAVRRIDIELSRNLPSDAPPLPPDAPVIHTRAYAYVEPTSFDPVEIVFGRDVYRFLEYRYLAASASSLALTDIRASHPTAKIVDPEARRRRRHPRPKHSSPAG